MKKFSVTITIFLFLIGVLGEVPLSWGDDELSEEQTLACEAILCLSSGDRPSECAPPINYFFGIKRDKPSDTKDARKNFLKKCPDSDADGMPSLINVLVDYNCSACTVEQLNARYVKVRLTTSRRRRSIKDSSYSYTTIKAVDPEMPAYCQKYYAALSGNEYTAYSTYSESQPIYVGYDLGQRKTDFEGNEYYLINMRSMSGAERSNVMESIANSHWEWFE